MRGPRRWQLAALLGLTVVLLTLVVGAGYDPLIDLDEAVARQAFAATAGHDLRETFWESVSTWGGPQAVRVAMLAGAAVLVLSRRWRLGGWLAVLALVEGVVAPAAKLVLERPRPTWAEPITSAGSTSFPSGHATAAMTAAVAVLLVARHLGHGRLVRVVLPLCALVLGLLVAASRLFLGVHYLTDVVGGGLLGAALAVCSFSFALWLPDRSKVSRPD